MCPDAIGPWGEDASSESPDSERPYGPRPYGPRPYGPRPYGPRFPDALEDPRPYGPRPYGPRPYGPRPYGPRPYGPRPYGPRPYGPRGDDTDSFLDSEAWSEDIAALVCDRSAVIRLGARLVLDEDELAVPCAPIGDTPAYVEQPRATDPDPNATDEPRLESSEKPSARISQRRLRPGDHELAWKVIVPDRLARDIAEFPELADAVKTSIASRLARCADQAFLHGDGVVEPRGITNTDGASDHAGAGDALRRAEDMLKALRDAGIPFGNAGWVLGPETLDALTRLGEDRRTLLDPARHLSIDGRDSGVLLGYPFIVSTAARAEDTWMIHFSADWSQAWIGADRQLVTVDISTDAHFQTDETVVRAVMHHDFALRHPPSFIYAAAND